MKIIQFLHSTLKYYFVGRLVTLIHKTDLKANQTEPNARENYVICIYFSFFRFDILFYVWYQT